MAPAARRTSPSRGINGVPRMARSTVTTVLRARLSVTIPALSPPPKIVPRRNKREPAILAPASLIRFCPVAPALGAPGPSLLGTGDRTAPTNRAASTPLLAQRQQI